MFEECGLTVRIEYDHDPESPRKDANVGTMACWHYRYEIGDIQPKLAYSHWLRQLAADQVGANDADAIPDEHVERILEKHFVLLPLCLYDHGGAIMSTEPFSCPWDSGQVGAIYCSMHAARSEWSGTDDEVRSQAEKSLRGEVSAYSGFLSGRVYGYVIEDDDGVEVESCWGFFELEFCIEEAKRVAADTAAKRNLAVSAQC